MTDKQIIIDGIDVSGCEWIREVGLDSEYICTCNSPNKTSGYCKDNPNCRYKQLKRKEQECEKLKEKLFRKEAVIDFACCPSYGYRDNDIEPTCTKTFCYDVESCEYKTMIKYEQALTEIKEIAEHCMKQDICTTCDNSDKCHIEDEEIPTYDVCKLILQKISEYEVLDV